MALLSGKAGTLHDGTNELIEVVAWSVDKSVNIDKYASNATSGVKKAVAGVTDWSGSCEFKVDDTDNYNTNFDVGDSIAALEFRASATVKWTGAAIVSGVSVNCDVDDGSIVSATLQLEGNGALTPTYS